MDGRKDGFVSIQLTDGQIFVQSRSGLVAALDAETGRTLWSTNVGKSYGAGFPLAINSFDVYALNGGTIYALDRRTGSVKWKFRQPEGLSAGPVADDEQIYLSTGTGRIYAYFVPIPSSSALAKTAEQVGLPPVELKTPAATPDATTYVPPVDKGSSSVAEAQPTFSWQTVTNERLEFLPLVSRESLMTVSPTGTILGLSKYPFNGIVPEVYRFKIDGDVAVPPGHYEDVLKTGMIDETAYIGGLGGKVYAFSVAGGKQRWRFTVGTDVLRQPVATDEDVYVTAERNGLYRLSRATGEPQWRIKRGNRFVEANPDADRLLAVNPKFVYAADKSGRLLVLDRGLGTELSSYDVRDFAFPVSNQMSDRLYLTANNGLIVCLHDKEYTKPVFHQKQVGGGVARSPEELVRLTKENLAQDQPCRLSRLDALTRGGR